MTRPKTPKPFPEAHQQHGKAVQNIFDRQQAEPGGPGTKGKAHPEQGTLPVPGKYFHYTKDGFQHLNGALELEVGEWMRLPLYGAVLHVVLKPAPCEYKAERHDDGTIHIDVQAITANLTFTYHLFAKAGGEMFVTIFVPFEIRQMSETRYAIEYRTVVKYEVEHQTEAEVTKLLKRVGSGLPLGLARDIEELNLSVDWTGEPALDAPEGSNQMPNSPNEQGAMSAPNQIDPAWQRRQVLATERLAAEMAESNRLKRLELGLDQTPEPEMGIAIGMETGVEWGDPSIDFLALAGSLTEDDFDAD